MAAQASDEAISREALHWLIALQDDPGDHDLRAGFEAWLACGPAYAAAWQEAQLISTLIVKSQPVTSTLAVKRRFAVPVAAFAMAACLLLALLPSLQLRLQADHVTATGVQRTIRLADDSVIHLGPDSAVAVSYDDTARHVALLRGEAYFKVTRDTARPFTVTTGTVTTTVLGTAFDVRRTADGVAVAVREGIVRVSNATTALRLGAGEWANLTEGRAVAQGTVAPDLVAAWQLGQLVVKDELITDMVQTLRRYHDGVIVLRGQALAGKRITGSYDLSEPAEALSAMVAPYGVAVTQLTPWVLVVGD